LLTLFLLCLAYAAPVPNNTTLHVTLLGQPCLLQGPFDRTTLANIHSIGPAQLDPSLGLEKPEFSKKESQKLLALLQSTDTTPTALKSYKTGAIKRVTAQLTFFESLELANTKKNTSPLLKTGEQYLKNSELKKFKLLLKKIQPRASIQLEEAEQLYELFMDNVATDPQEEFQTALKKLGISYSCAFEDFSE
jgi:hypothetical protein